MSSTARVVLSISLLAAITVLPGCGAVERLKMTGKSPALTAPGAMPKDGQPPLDLPMPRPDATRYQPNSLWRPGSRAFFKDQRAAKVGDILTVAIEITDKGKISNATERSRTGAEKADLTNLLGYEGQLSKFLPNTVDPKAAVSLGSDSSTKGSGTVDRSEDVELTVAAIVTQVLPNGNLVIQGNQEVRVNFEKRDLYISGVVRPEDISNTNTIKHTQIAEARISYGGQGQLTDMQQPRYGQQVFDVLYPF